MRMRTMLIGLLTLTGIALVARTQEVEDTGDFPVQAYTVAILPFNESGSGVSGSGTQVANILFAKLVENPDIWLVEREQLNKILDETELNISGVVNPAMAIQVGQLTGAKILVTGSVFKVKNETYVVAKIIGTETSRVIGCSANGTDSIGKLVEDLGASVNKKLSNEAGKLMPKIVTRENRIANIRKAIGSKQKPKVCINVKERHVAGSTIDPAAETELSLICRELGFEVTESASDADILIKGEGFSEFAGSRGKLISVRARLEVKALDKKQNVIAVDRQTCTAVDLAEQTAGKNALQEAAAILAERMIPKICR